MPKTKRKPTEKWVHPNYKRCYCYNRNGIVYFSINTKRIASNPSILFEPKNKQLALQYLNLYSEKLLSGVIPQPKTLYELLEEYKQSEFTTLKSNSQEVLTYTFSKYINQDYKLDDMLKFKSDLMNVFDKSKLSNNTKNDILIKLRIVLNFGVKIGWLKENVLKDVKFRKDPKKDLDFTFEDYEKVIKVIPPKYIDYIRVLKFLRYSGCRVTEAINLKDSSLLSDKIEIHGKGDKIRYIYNDYIDEYDFIFPNRKVTWKLSPTFRTNFMIFIKAYKVKWVGFHAIRKLRETELIDKYNLPDNIVAEMIGHTLEVQAKVYRQMRSEKEKVKFAEAYKSKYSE